MFRRILLILAICGLTKSSGVAVGSLAPIAPGVDGSIGHAPVVTAASSQYFERTFNRLVVPPAVVPVSPAVPPSLGPAPVPVVPVAPPPTVFVKSINQPVAVNPPPSQVLPVQPNVAVAVATAQAAAPVATILLPPYPFGFPPTFGFIPSQKPNNIPDENTKEPTTQRNAEAEITTTPVPESTTPIDASSSDNSFVQALPSNENVNFNLYGTPLLEPRPQFQPQPQQPGLEFRPQVPNPKFQPQLPNGKLPNGQFRPQEPNPQFRLQQPRFQSQLPQFHTQKPLFHSHSSQFQPQETQFPPYPPQQQTQLQPQPQPRPQFQTSQPRPQQSWPRQKPQKFKTSVEVVPVPLAYITPPPLHKTHAPIKIVKHIYTYVLASNAKIILKPVKIRPVRLVKYKLVNGHSQNLRVNARDIEITTFNPFQRPQTKPPRA